MESRITPIHSLDRILITGAAGFVGSSLSKHLLQDTEAFVVGLDLLTRRRRPSALDENLSHPRFHFLTGDIADRDLLGRVLREYGITTVVNAAGESSVDRSIGDPLRFVENNVVGTTRLIDKVAEYWESLRGPARDVFRFVQLSTIEVYGSADNDARFTEQSACAPNSPYAASKAASDGVARAYFHTYGLPTLIARSSTNYGPFQALERLIPRTTYNALNFRHPYVYGDGMNARDWMHVDDQCRGIQAMIERGEVGRAYNLGSGSMRSNLDVVKAICGIVDEYRPGATCRESLITFVDDRPGHDRNQAVDCDVTRQSLNWTAQIPFEEGLRGAVQWYVEQAEQGAFEMGDSLAWKGDYVEGLSALSSSAFSPVP